MTFCSLKFAEVFPVDPTIMILFSGLGLGLGVTECPNVGTERRFATVVNSLATYLLTIIALRLY